MHARTVLALLLIPCAVHAQRTRTGNRIVSTEFPNAVLEVAAGLEYAGTQTFDLYGVASAEQHFFVERDGTRIKRLLWIQYEGYHPANNNTYKYTDETVEHSGQTWFRSARAMRIPETEARPDSDGARARALLKSKGWTLGPDVMLERLVWILDSPARHELMVIYMEESAGQDLSLEAFHRRATASFTVRAP
jgi:hypothetical protein